MYLSTTAIHNLVSKSSEITALIPSFKYCLYNFNAVSTEPSRNSSNISLFALGLPIYKQASE